MDAHPPRRDRMSSFIRMNHKRKEAEERERKSVALSSPKLAWQVSQVPPPNAHSKPPSPIDRQTRLCPIASRGDFLLQLSIQFGRLRYLFLHFRDGLLRAVHALRTADMSRHLPNDRKPHNIGGKDCVNSPPAAITRDHATFTLKIKGSTLCIALPRTKFETVFDAPISFPLAPKTCQTFDPHPAETSDDCGSWTDRDWHNRNKDGVI